MSTEDYTAEQLEEFNVIGQNILDKVVAAVEREGITRLDASRILGINSQFFYTINRAGHIPSTKTIARLARYFKVSISEMIDDHTEVDFDSEEVERLTKRFRYEDAVAKAERLRAELDSMVEVEDQAEAPESVVSEPEETG